MKKVAAWIMKAIAGGVIALLALNAFAMLYYNVPVHYTNPDGATEYKWETSTFYSKGTEGFAWGVTNNDGFNNLRDYTPGERIDILLMGSSHMEGFNVAQDENAGAVLNTLFDGEAPCAVSTVFFSSPDLADGETATLTSDGESVATATASTDSSQKWLALGLVTAAGVAAVVGTAIAVKKSKKKD